MTPGKTPNAGHSVFERLLNYAKEHREDFNLLLFRYGIERLLYRLSISPHADRFILKGASLFLVWVGQNYRVTKDADLLCSGPADVDHIAGVFRELCQIASDDVDGMVFVADSVRAVPIREEQEYGGIRVTLVGMLHKARIPLQLDIGFGDAITPSPEKVTFPTLLNAPAPKLLAYSRYTMVAEKLEAMVRLGIANSRMKDFYDVWLLSKLFTFDGRTLCKAVGNTFKRRSASLPRGLPVAFTDDFRKDAQKQAQWRAFVRKAKPDITADNLDVVINDIEAFIMPVVDAVREGKPLKLIWKQGGRWSKETEDR
jgi:predicted nucleotidyltransferase component of viral defense system